MKQEGIFDVQQMELFQLCFGPTIDTFIEFLTDYIQSFLEEKNALQIDLAKRLASYLLVLFSMRGFEDYQEKILTTICVSFKCKNFVFVKKLQVMFLVQTLEHLSYKQCRFE